ncbi:peptidase U32 family protein [Paenibacillus chibensis]|uniref:peptidase U32 family protein n=1 Tax=Paenibacillus chibensis TaxID=59846 RepID=UPI001FE5F2F7|nr:U32 family peptidase [Paenibacillus chibensis]MEC0370927.1 U32 family peptidase [Paenibacillus chibensis]
MDLKIEMVEGIAVSRWFGKKEIELLAPVGTFEIFKEVIESPCDAVYLGGPAFNMRLMRKGYNFTLEEITEAVNIAHSLGKKVYVTVNNLLSEAEIEDAREYLRFLEKARVDALIVQDFAVLSLVNEMGLQLPLHASVMMNVHNLEMVKALQELGVTRVVTSREMDLQTARYIRVSSGMELEYFIHGDMCVAHGANCHYSSYVFGMSSSRGKCMKPCRWDYRVKKDGSVYPAEYPLAVKDMYMYEHIPELIEAGICSFKIEGRMRDASFVLMLVNSYADAIDRYIEDPVGFDRMQDAQHLYEHRKRDFSTAYAFGNPGLANINRRYEGTGKFYSTGRVFSTPTPEKEMGEQRITEVRGYLSGSLEEAHGSRQEQPAARLSVRVNNMAQARAALEEGADDVYLSGDVFLPDLPFTRQDIESLCAAKGPSRIILGLPRMMTELHFEQYLQLLGGGKRLDLDGLLVTNLGAVRAFRQLGYPMIGDASLNVYNHIAADFYGAQGLERVTASPEMTAGHLGDLLAHARVPLEMTVHGSPTVMYMEHDLYENTELLEPVGEEDNRYVPNDVLVLMTDKGENPVYRDQHGRNHLLLSKELCLLPLMPDLIGAGVSCFRIEGAPYPVHALRTVIQAYRKALRLYAKAEAGAGAEAAAGDLQPVFAGYTLGSLQFN